MSEIKIWQRCHSIRRCDQRMTSPCGVAMSVKKDLLWEDFVMFHTESRPGTPRIASVQALSKRWKVIFRYIMIYPTPLFCWGFGFGGEKRRVHPWHFFHGTWTLRFPTSQKRLHPPGQWENRWSDGRGVPQGGLVFPQCHWIPLG